MIPLHGLRMVESSVDESALCLTCGICCQGPLYALVELQPEEVPRARTWPIKLVEDGGQVAFKQPCGCLDGALCTVYSQRPKVCREYVCALLQRVRSGETSQARAQEAISQAHGLIAEIETLLPETRGERLWERIGQRWDFDGLRRLLESGEINHDVLIAIVALDVHLARHFRVDSEQSADS